MSHDKNNVAKKRPLVVLRRTVDKYGNTNGAVIKGKDPNTVEYHDMARMLENYTDGVDYIIEKGTGVSELVIVRRLTDNGMSYHFRAIHDGHENNNFATLETEVRDYF